MILWHELREPEEVHRMAEKFVALSREHQFPFFLALATCGYGWTSRGLHPAARSTVSGRLPGFSAGAAPARQAGHSAGG